jgi:hypothetical protein
MARRWRGPWTPRGKFQPVVPTPVTPPPPAGFVAPFTTPAFRARGVITSRTQGYQPFIPRPLPPPPTHLRSSPSTSLLARRGRFQPVPTLRPPAPTPSATTRRRPSLLARRGSYFWAPPVVVVAAGPGPVVQSPYRQPGRRAFLPRRGQFFSLYLVGGTPAAPPSVPFPAVRARVSALPRRGPGRFEPTPRPALYAPAFTRQHATKTGPPRRGRYAPTPPPPPTPPIPFRRCRLGGVRPRRGRFHEPPWPQFIPQPSVWRPPLYRARSRPPPLPYLRRGKSFQPPWVGLSVIPPGGTIEVVDRAGATIGHASRIRSGVDTSATTRSTGQIGYGSRSTSTINTDDRDTPTLEGS